MSDASCPIKPLDGLDCNGQDSIIFDPPAELPRPGDPAPGSSAGASNAGGSGGASSAGSPSAPSPSTVQIKPAKASSVSGGARNLRIPKRLRLRTFGLRGMRVTADVPTGTKVLDLRLMRRNGGRLKPVLAGSVEVTKTGRNGHLVLRWKPGREAVSKLLAGSHVLRVRVGPDRTRLSGTDTAPVRLVGPRLRAAAARRR
jgi:hypothetical protein